MKIYGLKIKLIFKIVLLFTFLSITKLPASNTDFLPSIFYGTWVPDFGEILQNITIDDRSITRYFDDAGEKSVEVCTIKNIKKTGFKIFRDISYLIKCEENFQPKSDLDMVLHEPVLFDSEEYGYMSGDFKLVLVIEDMTTTGVVGDYRLRNVFGEVFQ